MRTFAIAALLISVACGKVVSGLNEIGEFSERQKRRNQTATATVKAVESDFHGTITVSSGEIQEWANNCELLYEEDRGAYAQCYSYETLNIGCQQAGPNELYCYTFAASDFQAIITIGSGRIEMWANNCDLQHWEGRGVVAQCYSSQTVDMVCQRTGFNELNCQALY